MNYFFIIIVVLTFSIQSNAQFYHNFGTCEEAELQAVKDSENGKFIMRFHGLIDQDFSEFNEFFEIYMYSKYNIEFIYVGCITYNEELCYSKKMYNLIEDRYGQDFMRKKSTELESIFPTLTEKEKSEVLDLNKIYDSNLESHPKFIGNDKLIITYLKSIFNFKKTTDVNYARVKLTIDDKGQVINMEFNEELEFVELNKFQTYLNELNKFGDWVPGFIFNTKVKSKTYYHIDF